MISIRLKIGFEKVVDVAAQLKFLFDKYELPFYCKTSGSRGIHIYLPVEPVYSYEQVQNFAKLLETIVHNQMKDITSFVRNPNERRGRVYLDFLQNAKGKTMSSVYSIRPKPGATVSTPIRWQELNKKLNPADFTLFSVRDRIAKYGDVWEGFFDNRINLGKVLGRMG
ncbi:MAG: hypothetical protein HC906_03445 [Bacteroidales bacterium]|nr:hypothetical protein [Bacteroidales bacterium]